MAPVGAEMGVSGHTGSGDRSCTHWGAPRQRLPPPVSPHGPLFHSAAPSNERDPSALPSRSSAVRACAGVALLLMKDLFRSPPPPVHSSTD